MLSCAVLSWASHSLWKRSCPYYERSLGKVAGTALSATIPRENSCIEPRWSNTSIRLQVVAHRLPSGPSEQALVEALGAGLDTITAQGAQGWFGHCGYPAR